MLSEGRARIIKQGNDVFYNEAQVRCTRCVYLDCCCCCHCGCRFDMGIHLL